MRKIPVAEAVGMALCQDITRIIPGKEKSRAFKRGHIITSDDIPVLLDLGRDFIYIWQDEDKLVHEDDAAIRLAQAVGGFGTLYSEPNQGKVTITASIDGLLKVDSTRLDLLNENEDIILSTLHDGRVVNQGTVVAGTRIIPLAITEENMKRAEAILETGGPILDIMSFRPLKVGVITTGNEVYCGRIKDGFGPVLEKKIRAFGGKFMGQTIVPDRHNIINQEIHRLIDNGAELILVTGGMSVDPDDVTPVGIRESGAEVIFYGMPVLPGSNLMLAYHGQIPICGVPGCVMFNGTTGLDLIFPYLFAGERISRSWAIKRGHGGLCRQCNTCLFPDCAFGKVT